MHEYVSTSRTIVTTLTKTNYALFLPERFIKRVGFFEELFNFVFQRFSA